MENLKIYSEIASRTGGDIYIGVVGPVRTGKSTFIKRFMDLLVLPNITNFDAKERAKDELPQSASGRNIMTTELKFVPNEAVPITLEDTVDMKVRLIDCVGYLVPEAEGHMEGELPRMVNTPWQTAPMPFVEAAEMGTQKVIADHSTIGIVVTTDGTVTDLPRENYIEAEERVISELKELGKPFVILLNTASPYTQESAELVSSLENLHGVPVLAMNIAQLKNDDIQKVLEKVLYQFPMQELRFFFPNWVNTLEENHWLKKEMIGGLRDMMHRLEKFSDLQELLNSFGESVSLEKVYVDKMLPGEGLANVNLNLKEGLFYQILSESLDLPIENDYALISTLKMLSETKREYDKLSGAFQDVKRKGYGIVPPSFDEITLEKPAVFKQGSRYGIQLKARGETIHLIKAEVETAVAPIIGNEEQSKEFIDNLMRDYEATPDQIWDLNIFGKTLQSMVHDGIQNKIYRMPEDAQEKLGETLEKIMNEGSGGLICIIL
ncbi:MAG: stage IV sporulation protein A [Bacillota bacterium]